MKKKNLINPFFPSSNRSSEKQPIPQVQTIPSNIPQTKNINDDASILKDKKTTRKIGASELGISISAISQNKKNEIRVEKNNHNIIHNESFTPIQLLNEWKIYAESLTEEHHLKNTMLNCLPNLLNRDVFEVVVNNPVQEQRLNESTHLILSFLSNSLKNSSIKMKVRVSINNEKKLGFTSLEKFNLMVQQNESLRKLKDEFGLELL